jgi:hypothetical protein
MMPSRPTNVTGERCSSGGYIARMILRLITQNAEPQFRYTGGGVPKGGVMIVALVLLYFLPSMLAFAGGKRRKWKIVTVNVLAGWTIIGWIVSMIMNWAYETPSQNDTENTEGITERP